MSIISDLVFSVKHQPELKERFEQVCLEWSKISVKIFEGSAKKGIIVNLFYVYDQQKHAGREFESSGGSVCWLKRLTAKEVNFVSSLMQFLAGLRSFYFFKSTKEFDVELAKFDNGIFTYYLTPKDAPAPQCFQAQ